MRSSRAVRASDSQCRSRNCPGFDPSILRHSGIRGAADEAVLNIAHKKELMWSLCSAHRESIRSETLLTESYIISAEYAELTRSV
jgi:hypothetical protein